MGITNNAQEDQTNKQTQKKLKNKTKQTKKI